MAGAARQEGMTNAILLLVPVLALVAALAATARTARPLRPR
jgi:hypothetical protein